MPNTPPSGSAADPASGPPLGHGHDPVASVGGGPPPDPAGAWTPAFASAGDRTTGRLTGAVSEPDGDDGRAVVVTHVRARTGPALVVVAIALAVVLGGFALALAGGGVKGTGGAVLDPIRGVSLPARTAAPVIARISRGGEPPADVTAALVVPATATVARAERPAPAVNLYSGTVTLSVPAGEREVATFFRHELVHGHFAVLAVDATSDGRGTKIFAKFPSRDGFYWEVVVVVRPTATSISPALVGDAATSTVSLTVFELDDAD